MKNILHYIGLLMLLISTLLGGLLHRGSDSILIFFAIGIIMVFAVYYLVKLIIDKKKETHSNLVHKLILWTLYLVIAFFASIYSLHFITVQFSANDDLRNNGKEKLETINQMRKEFNTSVTDIEKDLTMEVSHSLSAYQQSPRKSQLRDSLKQRLINFYEIPDKNLDDLKSSNIPVKSSDWTKIYITNKINDFKTDIDNELKKYYNDNKEVFNKIDPMNKNEVYYELDSVLINNKHKLENGFTSVIRKYKKTDEAFNDLIIPSTKVPLNSLRELRNQYSSPMYIAIYLLIHLLILFPILLTIKTGKPPLSEEDEIGEIL